MEPTYDPLTHTYTYNIPETSSSGSYLFRALVNGRYPSGPDPEDFIRVWDSGECDWVVIKELPGIDLLGWIPDVDFQVRSNFKRLGVRLEYSPVDCPELESAAAWEVQDTRRGNLPVAAVQRDDEVTFVLDLGLPATSIARIAYTCGGERVERVYDPPAAWTEDVS